MSIRGIRQFKRHRSMPLGGGVDRQYRNATSGSHPRQEIANSCLEMKRQHHLADVIVRSIGKILIFGGRSIVLIPIGCSPL